MTCDIASFITLTFGTLYLIFNVLYPMSQAKKENNESAVKVEEDKYLLG